MRRRRRPRGTEESVGLIAVFPSYPTPSDEPRTKTTRSQLVRASTASYRAFRATVKEGKSLELSNVPRVFATKQATIVRTQQHLGSMPKLLAEIEELYDALGRRLR